MLTRVSLLALAASSALAFGCSKSADNVGGTTAPPASVGGPSQQERTLYQAKTVVAEFLDALRRGDDSKARSMLTKVARQKAEQQKGPIFQGHDDGGKIEIDDASYASPQDHDLVHVPVRWIDLDEMGKPQVEHTVWVCRLEAEGWRVGGFAAEVFEGQETYMNFEDPEDMEQQKQKMEEEIQRREKAGSPARSSGEGSLRVGNQPKDAFQR